ncbi:hypothetical protein GQX74_015479 [Glossina fuscipes]|nr:hypothetical protein GQX74_015479 [Glossina fuscipes]
MLPNEIQKDCMRAKMAADLYGKGCKTDDVTVIVGFDDAFEVLNVDSGSKESVKRNLLRKPSMLLRENGIAKDWEPRTRPISWKDPVVREVRRNSKIIQSVCNESTFPRRKYNTEKMEICLALYDEDDQWYRALFLAYLKNGTVLVHYFDYGNVSKNMSKELIFPLYAHQIYIDDCKYLNVHTKPTKNKILLSF